jgi:periplasmic protein TonB
VLGVAVSVLAHLALIAAFLALVRTVAPPVLFVDLAHGLDVAEGVVSDLRRAVADARSRVLPRAGPPRPRSEGAPRPAAPASPPSPAAQAETRRQEPASPVAPEPVRPAPEPSPPIASAVPTAPPRPEPRGVDLPPIASLGDGAASVSTTPAASSTAERPGAPVGSGRDSGGGGTSGTAITGATYGDGSGPSAASGRSGARDGAGLALAIPGNGNDPAAADYDGYRAALRQRLHESLTYPPLARRRGLSGTVVVDVEVDASGKIGRVTLVASSSHAVLDDAALDAMRGVPRVPFPPGVPPRRLLVRLPVVFEIR